MRRVYTDKRFPAYQIHNDGGNTMVVYQIDSGELVETDRFRTFVEQGQQLPEDAAARRAEDYFNRMEQHQATPAHEHDLPGSADRDISDFVNNQHPDQYQPEPAEDQEGENKSLDDMIGNDELVTSDHVINSYEQAAGLQDEKEKEMAMRRVSSMAQQMESAAQELVRNLLS